ncbi:MAG TPA: arsinothricin resistance N-acetyltransferase ArsN1 family A [Bacillota bacterium]|nr:arsinothricin resistance N-acetyltransferase ArsN1 family A [Bacillota bacterium]
MEIAVRPAVAADAAAMALIYNQGIEDRVATFETELRTAEERTQWLREHGGRYPVVVAKAGGEVVGWASASQYRPRACYNGIGEFSVYVRRDWRGRGVGAAAIQGLIEACRAQGLWKLVSRVFDFNHGSRALCRKMGFREVGVYERHGQLDGRWCDCVIVERLL